MILWLSFIMQINYVVALVEVGFNNLVKNFVQEFDICEQLHKNIRSFLPQMPPFHFDILHSNNFLFLSII